MDETKTVLLEFKTDKAPVIPKLSLDFGPIAGVSVGLVCGLMLALMNL
jgi:hypothetical protein